MTFSSFLSLSPFFELLLQIVGLCLRLLITSIVIARFLRNRRVLMNDPADKYGSQHLLFQFAI